MGRSSGGGRRVDWGGYLRTPGIDKALARWRAFRRAEGVRFSMRFLAWFSLLQLLFALFLLQQDPIRRATAVAVAATSGLFGVSAVRKGDVLTFDGTFSYVIVPECTALTVVALVAGAVLAHRADWRTRAAGIALLVPFVLLVNLVRLGSMAWLGVHQRAWFDVAHQVGWEAGLVLAAAGAYLAWTRLVERQDAGSARTRRIAALVTSTLVFAAIFLGVLGPALWLHGDAALAAAIVGMARPLGRLLWGSAFPTPGLEQLISPVLLLTSLVGYASLILAAPGAPPAARLRAAFRGALLPALVSGIAGALLMAGAQLGKLSSVPVLVVLVELAYLGVPALGCILAFRWLRGGPDSEPTPKTRRIPLSPSR